MIRSAVSLALKKQLLIINYAASTNTSFSSVVSSKQQKRLVSSSPLKITHLDHLVLTVKDINTTVDFYTRVLCMECTTFKGGRKALNFGEQKINLHEVHKEFEPKAYTPTPGSADLCFITSTALSEVSEHFKTCKVDILEGPVERTGAVGTIRSLYP
uniref:Glyoxalase domain-containing protein 5 n=1 Tax=Arion vulgaris TaxID=1028688 RepID=A0A0B6ZZ75_9EUPU